MRNAVNSTLAVTSCCCFGAAALSVYPGRLQQVLIAAIFIGAFALPAVLMVGSFLLWFSQQRMKATGVTPWLLKPLQDVPWRRLVVIPVLLVGTYVALKFYVPRRLVFLVSRPSFERLLPTARSARWWYGGDSPEEPERVGIYTVDATVAHPRGGVFFRTQVLPDGPDKISYGFVYRPNRRETPFGTARYRVSRLVGDWFWFRVSNDY